MNRLQSKKSAELRGGFTLVELMYATVVGAIVMTAIGGLVVGYWRTALDFIAEEQTMQEISFLSDLFRDNSRALPSMTDANTNGSDYVAFQLTNTTSVIAYDSVTQGVKYDPDTSSGGDGAVLLSQSVVNDLFSVITTNNMIILDIMIVETELNKTNDYRMYTCPRNYEH